jgi:hypothetical protein
LLIPYSLLHYSKAIIVAIQITSWFNNGMNPLVIVGRAEKVELPQLFALQVPAKIDTGADASSIWAYKIKKKGNNLNVIFFGPNSEYYDGKVHIFSPRQYTVTRVSSSFGHREIRYKVKLKIRIKGKLINGTFTLANRETKLYPILIGRSLLRNKFLVDVSKGSPLIAAEKARKVKLYEEMANLNHEEKL